MVKQEIQELSFSDSGCQGFRVFGFQWAQLLFQPCQPLLRILKLCYARVSVFPEVKEFIVVLDGFVDHFLLRKVHPADQILKAGIVA